MKLENWDSNKNEYVLYQNAEQHNADCERFPFESIPRRVFLDTNVINLLIKFDTYIFEQAPVPSDVEYTRANDIEALCMFFMLAHE